MSRIHLTERQWDFIRPLLPPHARTGRPRADDRRTIEGILYVLVTGCRWQDLPREYGAPTTVWRRLKRWGEEHVWERIWRAALSALDQHGKLDWSMAFLDGSFAPAKKGGEKVGLTKKGKGAKWMFVIDGNGLPLGFHSDSAKTAEVTLAEQTLERSWSLARTVVPSRGPTTWWRIGHMIVARSARRCDGAALGCASHQSAAQPSGAPKRGGPLSRARRSIGSDTKWNAASLGWGTAGASSSAGNTRCPPIAASSRVRACGYASRASLRESSGCLLAGS